MKSKYIPIVGTIYGQWEVISEDIKQGNRLEGSSNRQAYWKVKCQCGRISWRNASQLVNNVTNSCRSCAKSANNVNTFINTYHRQVLLRCKIKNFECNITPQYLEELYLKQNKKCAISGLDIQFAPIYRRIYEQTISLDRIDSTKGYIEGNVQWVHKNINMMKGSLNQDRFIELCSTVSVYNKMKK